MLQNKHLTSWLSFNFKIYNESFLDKQIKNQCDNTLKMIHFIVI